LLSHHWRKSLVILLVASLPGWLPVDCRGAARLIGGMVVGIVGASSAAG
jgi:hypothetical protein